MRHELAQIWPGDGSIRGGAAIGCLLAFRAVDERVQGRMVGQFVRMKRMQAQEVSQVSHADCGWLGQLPGSSAKIMVNCLRTKDEHSKGRMISKETLNNTTLELTLIDMKWLNEFDGEEVVAKEVNKILMRQAR